MRHSFSPATLSTLLFHCFWQSSEQSADIKYFDLCPPNTSMQSLLNQALTPVYCQPAEIWKWGMFQPSHTEHTLFHWFRAKLWAKCRGEIFWQVSTNYLNIESLDPSIDTSLLPNSWKKKWDQLSTQPWSDLSDLRGGELWLRCSHSAGVKYFDLCPSTQALLNEACFQPSHTEHTFISLLRGKALARVQM
jgi:hypothetical protein